MTTVAHAPTKGYRTIRLPLAESEYDRFLTIESIKPTVSPLMIPLVYCHINSFQRASSMEKPFPGGENRRGGRALHHVEL
jgi:hypothetical protein